MSDAQELIGMDSLRELESVQPRSDLRRQLHLPGGRTDAVNWPTSCSATRHVKCSRSAGTRGGPRF
ncbi:hypothetical protein OHV08_01710 [Streptomyces canus]|uniref:hypothetical protein n=2 Tax=Streptomyces canus TaxID=58343 RepID=UPI0032533258